MCVCVTRAFLIRQRWQQEVGCGFGAVSQEVADCITAAQMEVGGAERAIRDGLWAREREREVGATEEEDVGGDEEEEEEFTA